MVQEHGLPRLAAVLLASLKLPTALLANTGWKNFDHLYEIVAQSYSESNVKLIERTSVICYNHVNFVAKLDKLALPPQEAIFNKLGNVEC